MEIYKRENACTKSQASMDYSSPKGRKVKGKGMGTHPFYQI
jgi:hypothetical protein